MTPSLIRETVDKAVALGTYHGKLDALNAALDIMAKHGLYRSEAYQEIQRLLKQELESYHESQSTKEKVA